MYLLVVNVYEKGGGQHSGWQDFTLEGAFMQLYTVSENSLLEHLGLTPSDEGYRFEMDFWDIFFFFKKLSGDRPIQ